ncbi:MAG: GAF domain-containing protein [Anaerolineae bacterium]|nr:GAF domain-containing protein [Anaerolineae bacterium]
MERLTQRFTWRNLPIRTKLWVLIGAILLLMLSILLVIRGTYANLNSAMIDTTSAIVEIQSIPEELSTSIDTIQSYPERYIQVIRTSGEVSGGTEALNDLTAQAKTELTRLEQLSEAQLVQSETNALNVEIVSIRDNLNSISEEFGVLVALVDQQTATETGALTALDAQGDELTRLSIMQNNIDMATQVLTLRSLESRLATQDTEDILETFQVTADVYLRIYNNLPAGEQVSGIPEAMEAYLASAEAVSDLQVQIDTHLDNNDLIAIDIQDSISQIQTIVSASDSSLFQQIYSYRRTANWVMLISMAVAFVGGIVIVTQLSRYFLNTIQTALSTLQTLERGDYSARIDLVAEDEFGQLSSGINTVASTLQELSGNLEQRVAERTRDMVITTEIGRAATTTQDPYHMMSDIIELIRQRFGYYHAQVFFVDEEQKQANLFASTGTAGRQLLLRKHFLPVGSQSVIGQVTGTGKAVIASDTSTEVVFRRNELLPDTRSEMALPMRIGDRVIGALDIQSVAPNAFSEDVAAVFQIVADQLALSVDNARLQNLLSEALTQIELTERRAVTESWQAFRQHHRPGQPISFVFTGDAVQESGEVSDDPVNEAIARGQMVSQEASDGSITLAVPIKVRGEIIGAFGFGGENIRSLSDEDVSLVEAIIDRVGLALENLRLVEETSRRAEHEQVLNEITAKLVGSTDVNEILQTTVRELGRVLRAPQTSVQLRRETTGR